MPIELCVRISFVSSLSTRAWPLHIAYGYSNNLVQGVEKMFNFSGSKQFWKLEHISFELWHPEACFQYWTIYVQSKGAKLLNCTFLICNFPLWKICWFLSSKKWNFYTNDGASRSKWQIFLIMKISLYCHSKINQPDIITIRILLWLSDKQQKRK